MFVIKKIQITDKNKEILNVDMFDKKEMPISNNYTTLILGENGVGKSFLLKSIIDIFLFLEYAQTPKRKPRYQYENFCIEYQMGSNNYCIVKEVGVGIIAKKNGYTINYKNIELPKIILALSFMVNDKFQFTKDNKNDVYIYHGVRSSTNSTYTSSITRSVVFDLIDCIKYGFLKEIAEIFTILQFDPIVEFETTNGKKEQIVEKVQLDTSKDIYFGDYNKWHYPTIYFYKNSKRISFDSCSSGEKHLLFAYLGILSIITAQVARLHKFSDFEELYKALPLEKCGYSKTELDTAHYTDMEQYYTKEQIEKHGALGIELCNISSICNIKEIITEPNMLQMLAPSVYNPTEERLLNRAKKYQEDENTNIHAYKDNGEYKGIVIFKIANNSATILDIAVKPEHRGQGIGSKLIDFIFDRFEVDNITAETDDDAIGFYKKYGFTVADTKVEFDTKRYVCVCESVTHHYDLLIDENNDPVHDPKPLQDYMDKWDGEAFIDKMELNKNKSVLEIGVGTGRLAVRVAPLCGEFYGVDISSKTIERATENLAEFENVRLTCADFLSYEFGCTFDVVYSSLTFMHIEEKQKTINKVAALLEEGGKFVLSIDKNQDRFIDTGTRKVTIYPDTPEEIKTYIANSSLLLTECYETEFAHIFVVTKE